ncbi:12880_t:CDS:2 [Funneliformis mosseae]|uniref:12880_t:CDS:1 n=1 Tax=Funneliformis mosseae TaxID=27381 RepID=A0A9N9CFK8_FUNMO|nr:12880_t:CDS:2 [Funneliformis mosseae]
MASPQAPGPKKLNLHIPTYSNAGSPVSPSSPVFSASPAFNSPKQFDSVPPSPTFSGSWNVNKSHAELTSLLKEAYGVIRERERDLTLAAEIGKSLLENNIALKSKYESTIVQLQHAQRARNIISIQHPIDSKHATPIAPPNNSLEDQVEFEDSDNESHQAWTSSHDYPAPYDGPIKRKNRDQQNSGLNYKDLENLRDLEMRNQELQQQLDDAIRDYNECDRSNKAKVRKLEADVKHFQDECLMASQKIEDLERETDRLTQKQKADFWNIKYNKKSNENDEFIDALVQRVQELEDQNTIIERSKADIERRCSLLTAKLETLQSEFDELSQQTSNYDMLQIDNLRKDEIIAELNESLEEQRALVVNYRSGFWSQRTSRANSISDGGNIMSKALRRVSDPDGMRAMFGVAPKQNNQDSSGGKIKKTLLSELENEWFRNLTMFKREVQNGNGEDTSPPFSPISSEKDLSDFFILNGARPDDDNLTLDYLSDDEFSFLDEFEVNNEDANRRREWFWRRWARAIVKFLRMIWRWCRFLFFLVAGLFLALYRGPDYLLPNEL